MEQSVDNVKVKPLTGLIPGNFKSQECDCLFCFESANISSQPVPVKLHIMTAASDDSLTPAAALQSY